MYFAFDGSVWTLNLTVRLQYNKHVHDVTTNVVDTYFKSSVITVERLLGKLDAMYCAAAPTRRTIDVIGREFGEWFIVLALDKSFNTTSIYLAGMRAGDVSQRSNCATKRKGGWASEMGRSGCATFSMPTRGATTTTAC